MQQWRDAKSRHPDALIFFRVGDFYEMFHEDAVEGARLLGLTLTARNNGGAADVPLAGVPVRARDEYLERLVRLGRRVAVCEQVEDPALARGIVRREVVETITPGTVLADSLLADRRNNWLVAVAPAEAGGFAVGAADISTGEIWLGSVAGEGALAADLAALEPAELLLPAGWEGPGPEIAGGAVRTHRPEWLFEPESAAEEVRRVWGVRELEGFGFGEGDGPILGVLGAALAYLREVQPGALGGLRVPRIRRTGADMALDDMTRRNLELVEALRPHELAGRPGTLLEVIDETLTPMGGRLLRRWLLSPLVDIEAIWARQLAVEGLHGDGPARRALRSAFKEIRDMDRLTAKVAAGRIAPRELAALGRSLGFLPAVKQALAGSEGRLAELEAALDPAPDVRALIEDAIVADAPASLADGDVIRAGFDAGLDALRDTRDGAQDTIARLQARERERTGIASLKVGYNKVFGYYLEVTRANRDRVPDDYERRQTLANAERYVTPELKQWESRILDAQERIADVEGRLFAAVRARIADQVARLQAASEIVAALDVLAGLAQCAERRAYVRPTVHRGGRLEIIAGRHPVVETMMPREEFIPNDITLDEDRRILILTGPNMAGKSTLLRQVGLIQLLAQVGAFVPADAADVPVCDRIFTRVGASDSLARGQSTFMVEMHETASILHAATRDSLVLLDEIGRGTATYDGVSIAWAVTEHLHERTGAKTIFATHYHELTQLADLLPALVNGNVAVREAGQDIVFLHRLQPGGADRSYGIEVGRLAGLPAAVVERAREILHDLEGAHTRGGEGLGQHGAHRPRSSRPPGQLSLFQPPEHPALKRLREADIDRLTPLEALNLVAALRALAHEDAPPSPL